MRGSVVPEVKPAASLGNEKKGKKGCSKKMERKDDGDDLGDRVVPVIRFGGKFKTKKKRSGNSSLFSAFGLLGEDEDGDDHESKENDDGGLCVPAISFSGKEKPSKSKKSGAFELLEDGTSISKVGDDSGEGGADDPEEGILAVRFSGKNKSSTDTGIGDAPSGIVETDQHGGDSKDKKPNGEEVASKNSRKKKKGGNNLQEDEDDLDKLLAEFGAVPSVLKPVQVSAEAPVAPPRGENLQNKPEQEEAEEEVLAVPVMSKKKKKKKEKEKKTSNSAAEEAKNEINSKTAGKKVPKHIREMQEKLAKLKEAVERKKREEEERFRKEEEERLKQEELERLAEEKRRLKKEKEKEKLLKKKQEGKLLTGKQKEEARRLESMKKQILANANLDLSSGDSSGPPAKRPRYQKKKLNRQSPSNGADSKEIHHDAALELDSVEPWEVELSSEQDKAQLNDAVEDYGVGDVEDWDSKSWEDDLKFPGRIVFADEEVDSEPGPLTKKDLKNTGSASVDSVLNAPNETAVAAPEMPPTPENVDVQTNKWKPDDNPFQNEQNLRSPICCIMGHVNAGKTQLLDCIRGTKVQEGEAGGITQQIGATYFPAENIRGRTRELKADAKLNVPGLLVIDTPGHESFTNLRSRGSGLCDLAILVVDIMHGLEPQTIESLNLLKMRNTDFIIALNKVDRLYGWKTCRNAPIGKAIEQQTEEVKIEFKWRLTEIITQFKEQGLNTQLYYKNKEWGETYNIVPTSAISGEGVPDLLLLLVQWAQKTMVKRLTYSEKVQCTVLEVKVIEGHGTTIDVVLVNGVLHEGDQIVVCGMQGPVVTTIRALLTPHPMRELRVKGTYLLHKEIKAAQGIKIAAQGLEHTIAGSSLYVVGPHDDVEDIKEVAMEDVESVIRIDKSGEGVYVQASTLGSLEALLGFLKTPAANIPVSAISIGPVHKKDVRKASFMLEKKREYGTILAFDVKVTPEAQELADKLHVKILRADIIYHLFDKFKAHRDDLKGKKKRETAEEPVFPCVLRIMPDGVFHKKYPIVLGVDVIEGIAKIGTPLCVPQKGFIDIGRIASIQNNHKSVDYAKKGQQVAIKIIGNNPEEQQKMFGRHFEMEDRLVSKISRRSLDAINDKDDLSPEDIQLLFELKEEFGIT